MARTRKKVEDDLYTPMESYAISLNEFYKALRKAGFPVDICLTLLSEKGAHPEWMIPGIPDFDPNNPDFSPFEDDED